MFSHAPTTGRDRIKRKNTAVLFFFYRLLSTHLDFIPSDFLYEAGSQDQFFEGYSTSLVSPNSISKVFEEKKKKMISLEQGAYLLPKQTL